MFAVGATLAELESVTVAAASYATVEETNGQAGAEAPASTEEPVEIGK
jgi:hypothetical protein